MEIRKCENSIEVGGKQLKSNTNRTSDGNSFHKLKDTPTRLKCRGFKIATDARIKKSIPDLDKQEYLSHDSIRFFLLNKFKRY